METQTSPSAPDLARERISHRNKPCGCPDFDRAITRRSFLKRAGAAGLVAGLASETAFTRLAFGASDYSGDVLVILSLRGGFDGLQAVVPAAEPHYSDYVALRPNLRIPSGALLPLDSTFGLHPALGILKPLYDAGTFGIVHAVGMADPDRSHFSAMEELERAAPGTSVRTGWIDRVLGLRQESSVFQGVQVGSGLPATAFLGPSPELAMWSIDGFGLSAAYDDDERLRWDAALRGVHTNAPAVLRAPATAALDALETAAQMEQAGYTPANGADYPDSDLGNHLRDVARLIKQDVGLEVASVDYGDWDMHAGMGDVASGWMYDHLTELGAALAAFSTDLGGMSGVTLVTLTEFGRRGEENGSGGTDHGYGQVVFLLGDGVNGGQVHGDWPGLADDDLVDGDLAKTTDYRSILAEILEDRCGAAASDVNSIFPGAPGARPGVVAPLA
jgi:uncharacterized protein (DUF1501 family)